MDFYPQPSRVAEDSLIKDRSMFNVLVILNDVTSFKRVIVKTLEFGIGMYFIFVSNIYRFWCS